MSLTNLSLSLGIINDMLSGFLGWLGLVRPGALIEEEEQKLIDEQMGQLKAIPNWQEKVAANISARTQAPVAQILDMIALLVWQIDSRRGRLPISHLRYYSAILARLLELLPSVAPTPPEPAPAPPVAAPVAPVEPPAELPPVPPDMECPYYTKASAYPPNWNAAGSEERYLEKYPDVAYAVKNKIQPSGLWHYRCYGFKEARTWAGLDGLAGITDQNPLLIGLIASSAILNGMAAFKVDKKNQEFYKKHGVYTALGAFALFGYERYIKGKI